MNKLKDITSSSAALAAGLRDNGTRHKYYKRYISMENALDYMLTGNMYLSNGGNWNDNKDKRAMAEKRAFGCCFSCSTQENVAMWMLYSGGKGKDGAMLDYPGAVMKEILRVDSIDLGYFDTNHKYQRLAVLEKANNAFEIFLTDVIYTILREEGKKVELTAGEDHIVVGREVLDDRDIFTKSYAWAYEKECRLIVRISEDIKYEVPADRYPVLRIAVPKSVRSQMKENRLVRSPVYAGRAEVGTVSQLAEEVNWEL